MLRHFILISLLVLCGLETTKAQSLIDPLKARCFELGFEAIEEFEDILKMGELSNAEASHNSKLISTSTLGRPRPCMSSTRPEKASKS